MKVKIKLANGYHFESTEITRLGEKSVKTNIETAITEGTPYTMEVASSSYSEDGGWKNTEVIIPPELLKTALIFIKT